MHGFPGRHMGVRVWAGQAAAGARLCCAPQDKGPSSWSNHLSASVFAAAGDPAFTPSFFSPHPPQEVTSQPVMGFDPLPPLDSIVSYTRPERYLRHPLFLRWHSQHVPSTPSPPGLGACGCLELMSSSILEEEQPGLRCSPTGRMYRQDWSCCFSLVVTVGDGSCSQPLRQRPLKNWLFLN